MGGLHRNTYLDSPRLLDETLRLRSRSDIRFAGQITGCEGYVESATIGLMTGRFFAQERSGHAPQLPPETTAMGALLNHITKGHIAYDEPQGKKSFQPMNVNFGLFPPVETPTTDESGKRLKGKEKTKAKKRALTSRAKQDFAHWKAALDADMLAAE